MPSPNEIATIGHLDNLRKDILEALLQTIQAQPTGVDEKYLTVDQAAEFTEHGRDTVLKWIKKGKPDRFGNMVKLEYSEFSPGNYRISKLDLIAYGKIGSENTALLRKNNLPRSRPHASS